MANGSLRICNAELNNGKIGFIECAESRMTILDTADKKVKNDRVIILGHYAGIKNDGYEDDIFKVCKSSGDILKVKMGDIVAFGKQAGFQNAKLVPTSNKYGYYIAAIKGSLMVMNEKGEIGKEPTVKPKETKEPIENNLDEKSKDELVSWLKTYSTKGITKDTLQFVIETVLVGTTAEKSELVYIVTPDKYDLRKEKRAPRSKTIYYITDNEMEN